MNECLNAKKGRDPPAPPERDHSDVTKSLLILISLKKMHTENGPFAGEQSLACCSTKLKYLSIIYAVQ